jgi:hypothetical protein
MNHRLHSIIVIYYSTKANAATGRKKGGALCGGAPSQKIKTFRLDRVAPPAVIGCCRKDRFPLIAVLFRIRDDTQLQIQSTDALSNCVMALCSPAPGGRAQREPSFAKNHFKKSGKENKNVCGRKQNCGRLFFAAHQQPEKNKKTQQKNNGIKREKKRTQNEKQR